MADTVHLGPFELGERIGSGGMGEVYRATHRKTGVGVAIKVIRRGVEAGAGERFRREVQAHAGLSHPNIVYLFEYGAVDTEAAEASGRELLDGSPYVAMELADRGTLRDHLPLYDWSSVRRLILQILDGLAFSHAREVVHRDLKPENVLVFEPGDETDSGAPRLKLADFGIAHAFEQSPERETESLGALSGTPHYMAPEQAEGRWRDFGPWTDLYALGCVVYEIVCGQPPFRSDRAMPIIVDHLRADRPPLDPQFPVPDELDWWVRRTMAVDPDERFRRAADAARALPMGGDLERPSRPDASPDDDIGRMETAADGAGELPETMTLGPTVAETWVDQSTETWVDRPDETIVDESGPEAEHQNPASDAEPGEPAPPSGDLDDERMVPDEWRPEDADDMPQPLIGTGLGLFGLREVPFVDRDAERDRIWEALRAVERTGRPRSVLVAGRSGAGKSRLIDWMATRAHELGAATVFRALHTPGGDGPAEGLAGMVRRMCGAWKLDRDELYEYFRERLPPVDAEDSFREVDARALTELLEPTDDSAESVEGPRYRFSSHGQKLELLARLIRRYGRHRPTIVWLDDIQWGEQSLGLVEHLLEEALEPPPALVAVSYRSEEVAEDEELRERIEAVAEAAQSCRIRVEPLAADDHRRLVDEMLPLEPDLADRVASRTEGNPLFASQLIGEWIERSEIEPGPDGFRLTGEGGVGVPDDIHGLWMVRIDRLIADLEFDDPSAVWRALERAAALGREVDGREWRALCRQIELRETGRLGRELIDRALAKDTPDGWAFAHGMLVESLERRAREAGRWEGHHRQCVKLLEDLYAGQFERIARRVAEHWIEGGEPERAIEPLLREARRLDRRGDLLAERRILRRRQRILDDLEIPRSDRRQIENHIEWANVERKLVGSPDDVLAGLEAEIERAEEHGHEVLVARGAQVAAVYYQKSDNFERARRWARRSLEVGHRVDDSPALARAYGTLGWTDFVQSEVEAAHRRLAAARDHAADADNQHLELEARGKYAWVLMARGNRQEAKDRFQKIARAARQAGYRVLEANCMNALGDMARFAGDISRARSFYERYLSLYEELNDIENLVICRLNIVLVDLAAGRFELVDVELDELEEMLTSVQMGNRLHRHIVCGRLILNAAREEWEEFDRRLDGLEDDWGEWPSIAKDYPWLLELAADRAETGDQPGRAARTRRFARDLWHKIGDDEAVARLDERLQ